MLKHDEMIENVHRRIVQYEEEKKMKKSKLDNIFSALRPETKNEISKTDEYGYTEVASGTEHINDSKRIMRTVSAVAAAAVLVTSIGAGGVMLHRNKQQSPAENSEGIEETQFTETVEQLVQPEAAVSENPFDMLLSYNYYLDYPHLDFSDSMRERISELFGSVKEWKTTNNYNSLIHYTNGDIMTSFSKRLSFIAKNCRLNICDDNIIEYYVRSGNEWNKTIYECDSLYLISGIADIMESEFMDNGVNFDEDTSYYKEIISSGMEKDLNDITKIMLRLLMKGSKWKEDPVPSGIKPEISMVSEKSGRLDIIKDMGVFYTDEIGKTYSCKNPDFFSDFQSIVFTNDCSDINISVTLLDADYKEITSGGTLGDFVLNEFPSMLATYTESSDDNESDGYYVEKQYKWNNIDLRTETYFICSNGTISECDYTSDYLSQNTPTGSYNYSIDYKAFEAKIKNILKADKEINETSTTTTSTTSTSSTSATTSETQNNTSNEENQQQETTGRVDPPATQEIPTTNIDEYTLNVNDNTEVFNYKKPDVFIFDNSIDRVIAYSGTHNYEELDKFVTDKLEKMLTEDVPEDTFSNYDYSDYCLLRIYRKDDGTLRRDGYYVYPDGFVSICIYELENGEWQPAGCDGGALKYDEFTTLLKELLKNNTL